MGVKGRLILIALLAGVIVVALIQNHDPVEFSFLFWKVVLSKVILIPILLFIGFVIGYFAGRQAKR